MAPLWALTVFSLLPLLEAQSLACANLTVDPITNATLDRLSGRWFYIGSALRDPEYQQEARKILADFFYFTPNLTADTLLLQEYQSVEDRCIFRSTNLKVQRENGTFSLFEGGREHVEHLLLLRDPRTYILAVSLDDEKNLGMSFYADKPEATPEQLEEFHKALACKGMNKSEVMYTDWKKDVCEPLCRQQELERKKEEEKPREPELERKKEEEKPREPGVKSAPTDLGSHCPPRHQ